MMQREPSDEYQVARAIRDHKFDVLARFSGMPPSTGGTHLLITFLPSAGTQAAYNAALKFVSSAKEREHHFITFASEPGRGKTHLAIGVGWAWIAIYLTPVKYWQTEQLLDAMKREFDAPRKGDYDQPIPTAFETAERVPLLILDDLGAEKGTEWATAKLQELIDYRYINRLPTVFTTMYAAQQLAKPIASRLKEGVVVTLEGPDYRELLAKQRAAAETGSPSPVVNVANKKREAL